MLRAKMPCQDASRKVQLGRDVRTNLYGAIALLLVSISASGCVTISAGPDRIFDSANTFDEKTKRLYAFVPDYTADVQTRNTFIGARMYAIDVEYNTYYEHLLKERQLGESAFDASLLGLTAATTIVHGEAVKTTLAAISTAVAGAKTDIDQDVYMAQTLQILMNSMDGQRLAIRSRIDGNMKLSASDYTAWRALTDLDDYYRAGTIAGALTYLASTTGENAQNQKNLQNGITASGASATTPAAATTGKTALQVTNKSNATVPALRQ
jgi:hypothetical protein